MNDFGGDILLCDTFDGGEIIIEDGDFLCDTGLKTAVYLSILGGAEEDAGEVENNNTWWGNKLQNQNDKDKLVSRFQAFKKTNSLTAKNVKIAEEKIKQDLNWLLTEGICDDIEVMIVVTGLNNIDVRIKILKNDNILENGNYSLQWEEMKNGIR